MKKILSLLSLLMLCIVGVNAQTTIYSWESPDETTVETGGTAVATDGVSVGFANSTFTTIRLNGKADYSTDYVTITLDTPLKAGDKIDITAFRNKNEAQKKSAAKIAFDAEGTTYVTTGDGYEFININEAVKETEEYGTEPNTVTVEVPADAAGSTMLKLTRAQTQTNLFITKLVITRATYKIVANVKLQTLIDYTTTLADAASLPYNSTFADCYPAGTSYPISAASKTSGTNVELGAFAGWDTPFTISGEGTSVIQLTIIGQSATVTITATENSGSEEPVTVNKTISLVPGVWAADGATFAAYAFNSDTENAWFLFKEESGEYTTQVPDSYSKIILVRLKPSTAEGFSTENEGLNWDNKWNQTDDIDFTKIDDNTQFAITDWGSEKSPYEASEYVKPAEPVLTTYTATFVTNFDWTDVYAYAWSGEGDGATLFLGEWPGTKLTAIQGIYALNFQAENAPEKIIFNNGLEGEAKQQTADLDFESGKIYTYIKEIEDLKAAIIEITALNEQLNDADLATAIANANEAIEAVNTITTKEQLEAAKENLLTAANNLQAAAIAAGKKALNSAIEMASELNNYAKDGSLASAIENAQAAVEGDDIAALLAAANTLKSTAMTVAKATLEQVVQLAGTFGIDATAVQEVLENPNATPEQMANVLKAFVNNAIPTAKGLLAQAKSFFATFDSEAATVLASDFAAAEAALEGTDINAMIAAAQKLLANATVAAKGAMEKVMVYFEIIDDEPIKTDVANLKAAMEINNLQGIFAAVEQLKKDFPTAADNFIKKVEFGTAVYKDAGKTNGIEQMEAAIATAKAAIGAEDATIVTIGLAIRNLVLALENFVQANTTYTIAGTKDLTGAEEDWQVVETNNMTLDIESGLYTWTAENITVNAENQPQFKVVITDIDDKQTWVPASEEGNDHNWIITPEVIGGEGVYNITITFNAKTQEISVINKEWAETIAAAEALVDMNAVAVGKLLAAIETAKAASGTTDDKAALQAAIEQFKADNAPLEADVTSQFPVDYQGWAGATGFVGWAAPEVTTNDGRTTPACEKYESTCANTGDVFTRTLTGLANGTYRIELYGAAAFTSGRGFESELVEGDETAVYLYAETAAGTVKQYIPAHVADNFNGTGIATAVLDGVVISDGTVKLGMYKDKAYTNWHVVQIKGVTALVLAKDLYAAEQAELAALIAKAEILQGENGKEEFQAVLAIAKEATDAKKNWYNVSEIESIIANLKTAMENYKKANWYIDFAAGEYYVINATTGLKMAAGHNYGTRGIVNEIGLDLILTPYEESRTVTFNSRVSNGGNSQFLGENLYMDSNEWGWALLHQGSGFFYILEPNSYKYINLDADNNLVLSETPCEWIIVSKDGVRAQLLDELSEATKDNPVDATGLITAPNFNRNDQRVSAWVFTPNETEETNPTFWNNHNFNGGNQLNNCAESYHAAFTTMQTISGAPAGIYQLTAQGFYRQDDYEGEVPAAPVFFANEVNANVPVKSGSENGMSDASASFTNGLYTIEPITFEVKEDGMMYIGITASTNTQWVIWDNFQLKYFGKEENPATGISNVAVEASNNAAIYNLAGQRVTKAQKGLFIVNGKKQVVK